MTAPDLSGVLAGIAAAVRELADDGGLIDQLRDLLPERGQAPEENVARRPPASRPPWDSRVADAYTSIHAWARDADAELGTYTRGAYARAVAGGDRATKTALANVVIFCEDGRVPEGAVRHIARDLGSLLRAAQGVPGIDTAPAPAATLRQTCPRCGTGALQAELDGSTDIYCVECGARWAKREWPFLLSRLTA